LYLAALLLALLQADAPVLHEFLDNSTRARDTPVIADTGRGQGVLPALLQDKATIRPPAEAAPAPENKTEFTPDRDTDRHEEGGYHEPFSPSVAPFSRGTALDAVGDNYRLFVRDEHLVQLPQTSTPRPGRRLFYGRVLVLLQNGQPVRIPSPAPDLRVYRTAVTTPRGTAAPNVHAELLHDSADNLYARANTDGRYVLTYLVDAPTSYFEGPVPAASLSDLPPHSTPTLPVSVARAAAQVAARLSLTRDQPVAQLVGRLVSYFRAFDNRPLPPGDKDEDLYLALALGQKGVCRHRAFAFVVTAQSLGLPARMVTNEVHAFAEVLLPHTGWRRVDLGGAPLDLAQRISDEAQSRPAAPSSDPFPQPESYRAEVETRPNPPAAPPDDQPSQMSQAGPSSDSEELEVAIDPPRAHDARRGDALELSGAVTKAGHGVSGVVVDLYLSPPGGGVRSVWLGAAVSDGHGRFRARSTIPPKTPAGDERLIGQARH
jgi:transglutaminase-like putative cysteine protease